MEPFDTTKLLIQARGGSSAANDALMGHMKSSIAGRVFLAERTDDRLHRQVAIKILDASFWHRDEMERRFRAEASSPAGDTPGPGRLMMA